MLTVVFVVFYMYLDVGFSTTIYISYRKYKYIIFQSLFMTLYLRISMQHNINGG